MENFKSSEFSNKIINNPDFLRLLPINFLDLSHQNPANQAIQHRFIQLLNGSILPNLSDKGADFAFLSIGLLKHAQQLLQTALIFLLLLLHSGGQLHKPLLRDHTLGLVGVKAQEHIVSFPVSGFQAFTLFLHLGSINHIPALHPAA